MATDSTVLAEPQKAPRSERPQYSANCAMVAGPVVLVVGARGHCPATLYSRRPLLPAPLICISHLLRRCGRQMAQAWDGFCAAFHPPCALLLQQDELEEDSRRALRCLRVASTSLVFRARDAWWASDMRLSVSVPRREGSLSPHASAPLSAGPRVRGESQPCVSSITLTANAILYNKLVVAMPLPHISVAGPDGHMEKSAHGCGMRSSCVAVIRSQ